MTRGPDRQQRLKEHYEGLDRSELARQGREHLEQREPERIQRRTRLLWSVVRGLLVGVTLAGLGLALLVLWQMHVAGQRFAEIRKAAMEAYSDGNEGDR